MSMHLTRRGLLAGAGAATLLPSPSLLAAGKGPGGFSPKRLQTVTSTMQGFVDRGELGGVVTLLWRKGEVAQVNALGWRDPVAKVPMARNSIFRIASMTKPVTAVAALLLVEEGKFKLTDPIDRWLPELANRKVLRDPGDPLDSAIPCPQPIRVEDLFTHRSGVVTPRTKKGPLLDALLHADTDNKGGWGIWLERIGALPLAYVPGTMYNYGNSIDLLGMLVERASGQNYVEFMRQRLFRPLGMNDTDHYVPAEKLARFARLQELGRVPASTIPPETELPPFISAAAGLFSTVDDYLKFARLLLGGGEVDGVRLLKAATVADMLTDRLTPEQRKGGFVPGEAGHWESTGFGLAVAIKDRQEPKSPELGIARPGSFTWPGVFGTWWEADPKEQMIQVYMVPGRKSEAPRWAFQEAAYAAIES